MLKFVFLFLVFFAIPTAYGATVIPFSSPENSFDAAGFFSDACGGKADVASYTFTSEKLAGYFSDSRILVEKSPVGGLPKDGLCILAKSNEVRLYDGPLKYMHAKYAVCGNLSLVSTENFGDSSYPESRRGNKGWGAIAEDDGVAGRLEETFEEDWEYGILFDKAECNGSEETGGIYYDINKLKIFTEQEVELITSPGSLAGILDKINSAQKELLIEQFYIYRYFGSGRKSPDSPLLEAIAAAAGRNVSVKLIVDSNFYSLDKNDSQSNYYSCKYLENITKCRFLDKYSVVHTKGMVADNTALVSSINWNENSVSNNRETGVFITGTEDMSPEGDNSAVEYFRQDFLDDYGEERRQNDRTFESIIFIIAAVSAWLLIRKRK